MLCRSLIAQLSLELQPLPPNFDLNSSKIPQEDSLWLAMVWTSELKAFHRQHVDRPGRAQAPLHGHL
jgi:hypothetical protein